MKVYFDCFPCFMRQALEAARMATDDPNVQREVIDRTAGLLPTIPMNANPVDIGRLVHRVVRDVTGVPDPYAAVKKESNDLVLDLYPELKAKAERSADPLLTAIKIAGEGNIIDFGPNMAVDRDRSVERMVSDSFAHALQEPLDPDGYRTFQRRLADVSEILYLDNAGEIVCDKILIEELVKRGKKVTFVVRGGPVINDVTVVDARYVGMDEVATVITNGSDAVGTSLSDCSSEFREAFRTAELTLAKGQGNFEGLSDVPGRIFFLFKVKCPVVGRETGARVGTLVLKEQALEKVAK